MSFDKNKILGKAQKLIQQGKLNKAIEEYQKIVDIDPSDVRTFLKIGDLNAKLGNIEAASDTYKKVAQHYAKDGFFLKAIAVFKQILKLDPGVINVYLRLAELYNQLGLNSEAMKQYQIVVKHYENRGMKKESLDILQKMADMDPENIASKVKLAELYAKEGYSDQAFQQFDTVAKELKEKSNYEDLIKVLEKMTALNPKDFENFKELSKVYLKVGEPKKALAKLQICFKEFPKEPFTLELLAQAFIDLQQPEKAKSVYRELVAVYEEKGMIEQKNQISARIKNLFPEDSYQVSQSSFASKSGVQASVSKSESELLVSEGDEIADEDASREITPEKILSEVEVYTKYGLMDKAIENLIRGIESVENKKSLLTKLTQIVSQNSSGTQVKKTMESGISRLKSEGKAEIAQIISKIMSGDTLSQVAVEESGEIEQEEGLIVQEEEVEIAEDPSLDLSADFEDSDKKSQPVMDSAMQFQKEIESDAAGPKIEFPENVQEKDSQIEIEDNFEKEMLREDSAPEKIELSVFEEKEEDLKKKAQLESSSGADLLDSDAEIIPDSLDIKPQKIDQSQPEIKESQSISVEKSKAEKIEEPELPKSQIREDIKEEEDVRTKYKDEMEEADFFIKQGLLEEAQYIYESILDAEPEFGKAKERLSEILAILSKDKKSKSIHKEKIEVDPEPMAEAGDVSLDSGDLFDLGKELSGEIDALNKPQAAPEEPVLTFDEMFTQFKKGVAKSIATDDYQAHYDLGVAYKEMGLIKDAVNEFKTAMNDEQHKANSLSMIGLCFAVSGDYESAVRSFEEGLKAVKKGSEEYLSFNFDLAEALYKKGEIEKALAIFKDIKNQKASYRNVSKKIDELEQQKSAKPDSPVKDVKPVKDDNDDDSGEEEDDDKKNKISYI